MCGLCGKLCFDSARRVEPGLVPRMMAQLHHRGPDGGGEVALGPVALGHRRLSIIDLATGAQPMANADATTWVVFNGEIYNFAALRARLEANGHHFRTASDTEVIVHLYDALGDDCVAELEGMFAFALWDVRRQRLLLARDRVGIKPLYHARTRDGLVFASEVKALLCDDGVDRSVDASAIDRFLSYNYLPGTRTLHRGIERLAPGHLLTVEAGRVAIRQYWELRFDAPPVRDYAGAVERLQGLLATSVREHLQSDVPVGVLLSGGVDSTGVLSQVVAQAPGQPVQTFTMGFPGAGFADERPYARLAARRFGTVHHEVSMSAAEFQAYLPSYVWHMEEPVCEPPAVALHFVARAARAASVKVLLSGEGGDEAFGGYQDYRNLLLLERLKSLAGRRGRWLERGFLALARGGWARGAHYAELVRPELADYYRSRTATPAAPFNGWKAALYRPDFAEAVGSGRVDAPTFALLHGLRDRPALDRMLFVDTKTWLPDDLLLKADKMTMAASIELRVPLLDHRILEFAASLPPHFKVRGWALKRVLKSALRPHVPAEILNRRKTGFPVPYAHWLRHEMKEFVSDTLLAPSARLFDIFRREAVERLLAGHQRGDRGAAGAKEVFSLLVLELWLQRFGSGADAAGAPA